MSGDQLELDLAEIVVPDYAEHLTLAERFAEFHRVNGHVADALEALAGQWLAMHGRVSIDALMHRLRWESGLQTRGDVYKLNNDWCAFYSRLLVERRPEWAGAFRMRRSVADGAS